jgi:hypothetical protein
VALTSALVMMIPNSGVVVGEESFSSTVSFIIVDTCIGAGFEDDTRCNETISEDNHSGRRPVPSDGERGNEGANYVLSPGCDHWSR